MEENSSELEKLSLTRIYHPSPLASRQDIEFQQENFPYGRVYHIYSPKVSKQKKENRSRAFPIDAIQLKKNLLISNLPLLERARMQKYNIYCTPKQYNIMAAAPKYIFHTFHFNYSYNGHHYSKTHYFSVAPTLDTQRDRALPVLYRFSVCRDVDQPEHFSFNLYAIVGGYEDGFYFISRLDNNKQELAHKVKKAHLKNKNRIQKYQPKEKHTEMMPETVPFPHVHRPRFTTEDRDKREHSCPIHLPELEGAPFDKCLEEYMAFYNISADMTIIRENCSIESVLEIAKIQNMKKMLKTKSAEDIAKFDYMEFNEYSKHAEMIKEPINIPEQKTGNPYLRY